MVVVPDDVAIEAIAKEVQNSWMLKVRLMIYMFRSSAS